MKQAFAKKGAKGIGWSARCLQGLGDRWKHLLPGGLLMLAMVGCDDLIPERTTNVNDRLLFSTDTLDFDTIIATVGSTTRTMTVYNPTGKTIAITQALLQKGSDTPFRVNIDGYYIDPTFADVIEILPHDSAVVVAAVTLPTNGQRGPQLLNDTLTLGLESGVRQQVILTAAGQDAHLWQGKTIMQDSVLTDSIPYVIYDSLVVKAGVTLTLQAGCRLYFHDKASLLVDGRIVVQGTRSQPVVFRTDRLDRLFPYLPYDNTPARWGGITLRASSFNNELNWADIHGATYGIHCDSSAVDAPKISLQNSVIHNIGGEGLGLYHVLAQVYNTQLSNTLGHTLAIVGGDVTMHYVTVAQYYPWEALRGRALFLANRWTAIDYPLHQARFVNCVFTGYEDDVIEGNIVEEGNQRANYLFQNCMMRTVVSTDAERFINVVYEATEGDAQLIKHFKKFDTDNFIYDFTPTASSPLMHAASAVDSALYKLDRNGVERWADGQAEPGCYEREENKE